MNDQRTPMITFRSVNVAKTLLSTSSFVITFGFNLGVDVTSSCNLAIPIGFFKVSVTLLIYVIFANNLNSNCFQQKYFKSLFFVKDIMFCSSFTAGLNFRAILARTTKKTVARKSRIFVQVRIKLLFQLLCITPRVVIYYFCLHSPKASSYFPCKVLIFFLFSYFFLSFNFLFQRSTMSVSRSLSPAVSYIYGSKNL